MSTIIIIGGGGGHQAIEALAKNFAAMSPDDKAEAVAKVQDLINFTNDALGLDINPDQP